MLVGLIVAVLVASFTYAALVVSGDVDDTDSNESTEYDSNEKAGDTSELTKASISLNETSIIKIRDVSIQLQKLKANVSDIVPAVSKSRNSTSYFKQDSEIAGPCARTTCSTKNNTTTCTSAADCITTRIGNSIKLVEQATKKSTTAKSPILHVPLGSKSTTI